MELYEYTASSLSDLLQKGECSSVEVLESVWDRITQTEGRIKAYLTLTKEEAFRQAEEIDRRRVHGESLPPLAGIPIAVKDNICTKGIRTTCASRMLQDFVPPYDASVIERCKENGMVLLGKTNLDEFGMGSSCEHSYFQITRNPWDTNRVPGGSSGGSAAALAAGEAVLALGSDTGGSVRLPASYCGLVGLKPTYGTVSRYGLIAFASSLEQIGPMGRSVEDVRLLYSLLCGKDPQDATTLEHLSFDGKQRLFPSVKGKRIGIPKEYYSSQIATTVKENLNSALRLLEQEGAILQEISLPGTQGALAAYYLISSAEASSNLARYDGVKYGYRAKSFASLEELYQNSRSEGFGKEVKRRILLGGFVLSAGYQEKYYKRAKESQRQIIGAYQRAFETCDLLITPTSPDSAFFIGEKQSAAQMYLSDICTVPANIAGLPALSLPCGYDENGLPIGMQLIGPQFSEEQLFEAALCYEQAAGGFPMPDGIRPFEKQGGENL